MVDERRDSVLTMNDMEKIKAAFREESAALFENIGYDISTPESRSAIHADHGFVRDWRTGSGRIKLGALVVAVGGLTSGFLHIAWDALKGALK